MVSKSPPISPFPAPDNQSGKPFPAPSSSNLSNEKPILPVLPRADSFQGRLLEKTLHRKMAGDGIQENHLQRKLCFVGNGVPPQKLSGTLEQFGKVFRAPLRQANGQQRLTKFSQVKLADGSELFMPGLFGGAPPSLADITEFRVADKNNPRDAEAFSNFIYELDDESYEMRFGSSPEDLPKEDTADIKDQNCTMLFAYAGEKIVGVADHSEHPDYGAKVAWMNIVVAKQYQGTGVAKKLTQEHDALMRQEGYLYKSGLVFGDHKEQLARLKRGGWKESTDPRHFDEEGIDNFFWKALDPAYENIEPKDVFPNQDPPLQS